MSFSVDTSALAGLPALLDRMQEDARAAKTHLDAETSINWTGEGIINILSGGHRNVQDQIRTFFEKLDAGVVGPTAAAVRASIDHYNRTDRANAEAWAGSWRRDTSPGKAWGTIAAYREVLDAGFGSMQQLDLAEVAAALDAESPPAAPDNPAGDEEPEELFRGLDHENRRWWGQSPNDGC